MVGQVISSRSNKSIESNNRGMKKLILLLLIVPMVSFSQVLATDRFTNPQLNIMGQTQEFDNEMYFIVTDSSFFFHNGKKERVVTNLKFKKTDNGFEIRGREGEDVKVRFQVVKWNPEFKRKKKFRKYTHLIAYNAVDEFTDNKTSSTFYCYEIDSIPNKLVK